MRDVVLPAQSTSTVFVTLCLLLCAVPALGQSIPVRHDHDPWGSCEGVLTISEEGVTYQTDREGHGRTWDWIDIQGFDRKSPDRFSLLTYEDLYWQAGLDKRYDFVVTESGEGLTDPVFALIAANVSRPVVDRVVRSIDADYEVRVKHLHVFGGCEGVLRFGTDWVVYDTEHAEDRRTWNRRRQIASIWSGNPYEIELRVVEDNPREFAKEARFVFQLKEPIDAGYYETLRRSLLVGR